MSTRSAVGIYTDQDKKTWEARYVHWDGYPSGVGAHLFSEYNRAFKVIDPEFGPDPRGLYRLAEVLMSEKVGWSALCQYALDKEPQWSERSWNYPTEDYTTYSEYLATLGPRSYTKCGKTSDEPNGDFRRSTDTDTDSEWAYIFVPAEFKMDIWEFRHDLPKFRGHWYYVVSIDLNQPEPDWKAIENPVNETE